MNIIDLYEDLRTYCDFAIRYDDLFYDAPEGYAQIDIVVDMLDEIRNKLTKHKSTGIIRRIDMCDKISIPKEIKRAMKIECGDPVEIIVWKDGELRIKKYETLD